MNKVKNVSVILSWFLLEEVEDNKTKKETNLIQSNLNNKESSDTWNIWTDSKWSKSWFWLGKILKWLFWTQKDKQETIWEEVVEEKNINDWVNIPFSTIRSYRAYINPVTKTAQCSWTTRQNFAYFWITPPRWDSAFNSMRLYWDAPSPFPPINDNWNNIADLFLDGSRKNRAYWHRVLAFKHSWEWYVLDPYYAGQMWYTDREAPIPASNYISYMENQQWRNFKWAFYYKHTQNNEWLSNIW